MSLLMGYGKSCEIYIIFYNLELSCLGELSFGFGSIQGLGKVSDDLERIYILFTDDILI
jgi:hypothetical protein